MALEILAYIQKNHKIENCDYIFSTTGSTPINDDSGPKERLDKDRKLTEPYHIHDIRHTVRTNLSRIGIAESIAEVTIGHILGGMNKTYNHYQFRAEKTEALDKWAKLLNGIVAGDSEKVVSIST